MTIFAQVMSNRCAIEIVRASVRDQMQTRRLNVATSKKKEGRGALRIRSSKLKIRKAVKLFALSGVGTASGSRRDAL
jgi:hypothetical protein